MAELPQNPTDDQILAFYRQDYADIDMATARGLYGVRRRFRHLAMAAERKRQATADEERLRLRAQVSRP
jgi:hypothetical protein